MKDRILRLRAEGKTYTEIQNILGCSRSLIAYHVNPSVKEKSSNRARKNRFEIRENVKQQLGGKCFRCGYNKCLAALQFHHRDPKDKLFEVTNYLWGRAQGFTDEDLQKEILKCDLLCANCHAELHYPDYVEKITEA
jgi:hypothetical protein